MSLGFVIFNKMKSQVYQERKYRSWAGSSDLITSFVMVKETDLLIQAKKRLEEETRRAVIKYRGQIEDYIFKNSNFLTSFKPIKVCDSAPMIVKDMAKAADASGVGPMASVAGAIAEYVGRELLEFSEEVIVENGGDIFIKSLKNRRFGIFAGESPLTGKLTFEIMPKDTPLGVCTSSGTVGHSLSFGKTDAACIISKDTALADAVATATGNIVKSAGEIEKGIIFAKSIPGIIGAIVIMGSKFGSWGRIRLGE